MRILIVHSHYRARDPSGENIAVQQHSDALVGAGLEVMHLSRYTDRESQKFLFSLRSATHAVTGLDTNRVVAKVRSYSPDIVNIHNLYPNFGTRWITRLGIPTVLTLHNFRFTCANGLLFRSGRLCTECVVGSPFHATEHGCYQDSRLRSLPWSLGTSIGGSLGASLDGYSAFVVQSTKVKEILQRKGVDPSRIFLVPGFVEMRGGPVFEPPSNPRFLFVGRNTLEKGLTELLQCWPARYPLDVLGPGNEVKSEGLVRALGYLTRNEVQAMYPDYSALVFPGKAFEGAVPLVVREAIESGVPVIARAGSSAADFVKEFSVGEVYAEDTESDVMRALEKVVSRGSEVRMRCRETWYSYLREETWQARMKEVFTWVLKDL